MVVDSNDGVERDGRDQNALYMHWTVKNLKKNKNEQWSNGGMEEQHTINAMKEELTKSAREACRECEGEQK